MRYRIFALLCAGLLFAGVLTGCKKSAQESGNTQTQESEEVPVEESAEEIVIEEDGTDAAPAEEDVADEAETEAAGFDDGVDGGSEESPVVQLNTDELLSGKHHAEIVIQNYGAIDLELDADAAPITVTNFVKLAQEGFYDGLTFHRIIEGFMMQGGDTLGNGTGGSDETITGEFSNNGVDNSLSHTRGAVSMARSSAPDSASSQFFIVHKDSTYLDGDYAVFGYVTEGMDVVDQICTEAQPVDNNGTIPAADQPVISTITILD